MEKGSAYFYACGLPASNGKFCLERVEIHPPVALVGDRRVRGARLSENWLAVNLRDNIRFNMVVEFRARTTGLVPVLGIIPRERGCDPNIATGG